MTIMEINVYKKWHSFNLQFDILLLLNQLWICSIAVASNQYSVSHRYGKPSNNCHL